MNRPSWIKVVTDLILFFLGVTIIMRQAGLPPFPSLNGKPDYVLLVVGGLLCNGPIFLQALQARFGTGGPPPTPPPPEQALQSAPSSDQSSGGS